MLHHAYTVDRKPGRGKIQTLSNSSNAKRLKFLPYAEEFSRINPPIKYPAMIPMLRWKCSLEQGPRAPARCSLTLVFVGEAHTASATAWKWWPCYFSAPTQQYTVSQIRFIRSWKQRLINLNWKKYLHLFLVAVPCNLSYTAQALKCHTTCKLTESDLLGTTVQHWGLFSTAEEVSHRTDRRFREGTLQEDPCMCLLCMHMDPQHS